MSGCTLLHTGFIIQTIEMCCDTKNHPVGRLAQHNIDIINGTIILSLNGDYQKWCIAR